MLEIIDVSDAAKAFIKQHGGVVTVRLSPRHGCCGGLANVAVAEASSPNDPALACQGLRVNVEGFWKLRHLYVDSLLKWLPFPCLFYRSK